jgi:TPP-dependent pyruvate/acetoin dehydrogenase alpha subunit
MKVDLIKKLYFNSLRIRMIEERISREYANQDIRCPIHLSIGQEAISSPLSLVFNKKDFVVSNHRSHAHYLGKGGDLKKFIAELYGKKTGCSGGRGGSMHLNDKSCGFIASTPIVANSIPLGVGLALSKKIKKEKGVVIIFFGDAAVEEGVFFESLNFAIVKKLKVIFVCENNFYSVYSCFKDRQPKGRKIAKVVKSFGIKSLRLNGDNFYNNYKIYKKAYNFVKSNNLPIFIEFLTFRFVEHCGPNTDDHLNYRNINDLELWKKKDSIFEKTFFFKKYLNKPSLEENIKKEINDAFIFAKKSAPPHMREAYTRLYAKK